MIYKLLVIGHFIGDFYLQTDNIAKEKQSNDKVLAKHSFLYGLAIFFSSIFIIIPKEKMKYFLFAVAIAVLHYAVDFIKRIIEKKENPKINNNVVVFLADQIIHIVMMLVICKAFNFTTTTNFQLLGTSHGVDKWSNIADLGMGVVVCGTPASILVKNIFARIFNQVQEKEENPKVGSYIGIMERIIIFFLGTMGQFGAIGFVLAAKSVARYKQLEDQKFAEKYLVGTLLSTIIAISCIGIYNFLKI